MNLKFLILFLPLFLLSYNLYEIKIENGKIDKINIKNFSKKFNKYSFKEKDFFDKKIKQFEGIHLITFFNYVCKKNSKKITFFALDNYKISFKKNEIVKDSYFIFKENNKFIPIENKGLAKIIFYNSKKTMII